MNGPRLRLLWTGTIWTRAFTQLFLARFAAQAAIAVAPLAIVFAAIDLGGGATWVGAALAARTIPQVAFTLLGGSVADRFPRRTVLLASCVCSAVTQAVAAILLLSHALTFEMLITLEAINGLAAAFVYPAAAPLTPTVVQVLELQRANAILRIGLNVAMISGSAVAGFVVTILGPGLGLALDAALFALSAALFAGMRAGRTAAHAEREVESLASNLRAGWSEVRCRSWVLAVVMAAAITNMAYGAVFTVLGPVIADGSFGRLAWGLIVAAQTGGMLIGGLVAMVWKPSRLLVVGLFALVTFVPLLVGLGATPIVYVLFPLALGSGIGLEVFGVYWDLSLQTAIPQERLGRVYAYDALGSLAFLPLGQVVVGPVAVSLGTTATAVTGGVLVSMGLVAALAVPSVRQFRLVSRPTGSLRRDLDHHSTSAEA